MDTRRKSEQKYDTNELVEPVSSKPTYLQRRGHRYWFRYAIPRALQEIVGKPEFLASLHTTDLSIAKQRLSFEVAKAHAILGDAQRRLESATCTTRLACENDPEWVNAIRWLARNPITTLSPKTRIAETLRALTELEGEFGQDTVRAEVEAWLEGHCHLSATGMLVKPAPMIKKKSLTFEELLQRFREDQAKVSSPKTESRRRAQDALYIECIGAHTRIDAIDRETCRRFRSILQKLPRSWSKIGIRAPNVLKSGNVPAPMSPWTANVYLSTFAKVFEYAENEKLIEESPARANSCHAPERDCFLAIPYKNEASSLPEPQSAPRSPTLACIGKPKCLSRACDRKEKT